MIQTRQTSYMAIFEQMLPKMLYIKIAKFNLGRSSCLHSEDEFYTAHISHYCHLPSSSCFTTTCLKDNSIIIGICFSTFVLLMCSFNVVILPQHVLRFIYNNLLMHVFMTRSFETARIPFLDKHW